MEEVQMNEKMTIPTEKAKFVWDKKYVRPYESAWSIVRNFTLLNACCGDLRVTLSLLGINDIRCKRKPYFSPELMVYLNMTLKEEEIMRLTDMLAGNSYTAQFNAVRGVSKKFHSVISMKLKYCPECMKSGYHSVFHQAGGASTCFIHKDVSLNTFWNGGYVLGYHEPYKPLSKDESARMAFESVPLRRKIPDLYSEEFFLLPFERNSISILKHPFNARLSSGNIREVFIVEGIADSYLVENPAGMYLIEDEESTLRRRIYSSVYDPKDREEDIRKLITQTLSDTPADKDTFIPSINTHEIDIVSLVTQKFVKKLFAGISMDKIKLAEFDMFLEGAFNTSDDLEVRLVFIRLISGVKWAHMALLKEYCLHPYQRPCITANENTIYYSSYDWLTVFLRFGFFCTKAIIEDYCERMYSVFSEEIEGCGRIPLNRHRLFKKPAYVIEKETDGRVNVYVY